jgi:D-sedoheptulose 7-phosphate isomerase
MSIDLIKQEIENSISVKNLLLLDEELMDQVFSAANNCLESIKNGGKIIFCGNGGSFADAQHLSAEFTSRFMFNRPALASIALGTNSSSMSAIGNDYGYEDVFSREIEALGSDNDILITISTSGNSANVIKAIGAAEKLNIPTYVLTGKTGGKIHSFKGCIKIPSENTARIQECHILIGHIICGFVEKQMFGNEY